MIIFNAYNVNSILNNKNYNNKSLAFNKKSYKQPIVHLNKCLQNKQYNQRHQTTPQTTTTLQSYLLCLHH